MLCTYANTGCLHLRFVCFPICKLRLQKPKISDGLEVLMKQGHTPRGAPQDLPTPGPPAKPAPPPPSRLHLPYPGAPGLLPLEGGPEL